MRRARRRAFRNRERAMMRRAKVEGAILARRKSYRASAAAGKARAG
jgi:hypothetical protein